MIILIKAIKEYVEDNYPGWDVNQITYFGGRHTCASISHTHYKYRVIVNITTMGISIRHAGMFSDNLMPNKKTNENSLFDDVAHCITLIIGNEW